ncbi:nucleoside-diphosphate-sugar epimerase [Roseimicrobium gellanilyticum]|uniref:Nucleoside-diphosphate-sugar epimerase n=1 Tax=Roseimicrobium gellanilyticum TaxID=748857 RepID=A0A366H473_9BACT|nr:NAD(P)-dependent oxidoreductase [Roseimicrobium gellanilyticum]RBP36665.1 nucleoside-diphosphate-sugar epimerase [Roseimicrobium gellanilyticum]
MRIFVTGANGFIGRAFCQAAVAAGHEVLGLCRSANATLPDGCQKLVGDLEHVPWDEVKRFAPDALLHLAWIVTPGAYLNAPENDSLIGESEQLFRKCAELGVRHLAASGTCIEYAPSDEPLKENVSPLAPALAYSRGKVAAGNVLQALATEKGIPWSWFRIFYCYGEGEHPNRIVSWIMSKLASGEAVEVKTPDSVKDYIHVNDVASAMLWSIEKGIEGPINVGTGHGIRILDLTRMIATTVGADPSLVSGANPPAPDAFPITVADMTKLTSSGWSPHIPLTTGLERMCQTSPAAS